MHFTTKVICESTIGIKYGKVCAADITNPQLLVTRSTRGVRQLLQLPLFFALFTFQRFYGLHFTHGFINLALFPKRLNFLRSSLYGQFDFSNFLHQVRRLCILFWRLFQPPMCSSNSPVAFIDVSEYVRLVLHLEPIEYRVVGIRFFGRIVLGFEPLRVRLGAGSQVHFSICEKGMRTCPTEEIPAHFII